MSEKIRVLVVGCGHMGVSHARAYHELENFEISGLVSRGPESRKKLNDSLGGGLPEYSDYHEALKQSNPDAVCISTYPDTHEQFCIDALNAGCHVFIEKPLAMTVAGGQKLIALAKEKGLTMVVGYILRVHPAWITFIEKAKTLGKPLVMRMNLNQQSSEDSWITHKNLMKSMSPIVDCGVHYVDVMCQMVESEPVKIHAIGAKLSDEINPDMYNYGQLQITFEDGSVGWYEAAWGPMISETAFFVKDVIGPKGCVSIIKDSNSETTLNSADVDSHSKTNSLKIHSSELDGEGKFVKEDHFLDTGDEPDHDGLCKLEQEYFYQGITQAVDVSSHLESAIKSLKIVLAADESFRTEKIVYM